MTLLYMEEALTSEASLQVLHENTLKYIKIKNKNTKNQLFAKIYNNKTK